MMIATQLNHTVKKFVGMPTTYKRIIKITKFSSQTYDKNFIKFGPKNDFFYLMQILSILPEFMIKMCDHVIELTKI